MTPFEIAEDYILTRDVEAGYVKNLVNTARRYTAAIGEAEPWAYVTANRFLAKLKAAGRSPYYINTERRRLIVLWRHAVDLDLATEPAVRRIRITKAPDTVVRTFSIDEVRLILEAAAQLEGKYCFPDKMAIPRADFWAAFIRTKWDTGLRHVDVFAIRTEDVRPNGLVVLVQSKTGRSKACQLSEGTQAAITATYTGRARHRGLVFPWTHSNDTFRRHGNRIIQAAGLAGTMKWLRASAGTAYENANPGKGHELLGNTRRIFQRHYRDLGRLEQPRPLPPTL